MKSFIKIIKNIKQDKILKKRVFSLFFSFHDIGHEDFHWWWKSQKQSLLSKKQRRTSHFLHCVLVYPLLHCLQRPLPVFLGKWATRSLRTSNGRCAHLLDGLFWAFRGLPDVTVCVAGLPLPEDGRPLFGVWSVAFTRIREDASCAWNCLLFIVSLLDTLSALQSRL